MNGDSNNEKEKKSRHESRKRTKKSQSRPQQQRLRPAANVANSFRPWKPDVTKQSKKKSDNEELEAAYELWKTLTGFQPIQFTGIVGITHTRVDALAAYSIRTYFFANISSSSRPNFRVPVSQKKDVSNHLQINQCHFDGLKHASLIKDWSSYENKINDKGNVKQWKRHSIHSVSLSQARIAFRATSSNPLDTRLKNHLQNAFERILSLTRWNRCSGGKNKILEQIRTDERARLQTSWPVNSIPSRGALNHFHGTWIKTVILGPHSCFVQRWSTKLALARGVLSHSIKIHSRPPFHVENINSVIGNSYGRTYFF